MANNKDVKRGIVLYLDGKAVEANAQNIQKEMRKVKKEIDGCTIGSKEYIAATRKYQELDRVLREHRAQLKGVQKEHFSFINTVNALWQKWQVTIGAFLAAFAGVSLALSKFRKEMNATEESSANLKALTGLDDSSISWLQEQAELLSTTMEKSGLRVQKTAKEILEAYMLVGSAKPELLQDKEALNAVTIEALRLAEAAKMNLKDAVDGVTLSLNQYGESADHASRYVNVLAAGSKFGAANVESQTAAIVKAGVAAATANVPMESLVGSIETLAEKGIKGEVAGTGLKTFFLKLEGMADDVRPSVVGLETALENLRKKNLSTAETQKMFGLEAFTVAQAMITGADKVKEYTAAVTDTNVAIEQAAINSDTANAKMAQMKNEFTQQGIILVKELNPAITKFISLGMNSTRMLVSVVRFLTENRVTLSLLTVAITAYVAWVNRKILVDKLAVFWTDKVAVSTANLTKALKANPWGAAIAALTVVVGLIADYNRNSEKAVEQCKILDKVNKTTSDRFAEEAGHVDRLNKQLHSANLSYADRKKALDELKTIIPGYLADLTKEGKLINDNTTAIDNYLAGLEKRIKMQAAQEELEQAYRNKRQQEKELEEKQAVEDEKRKAKAQADLAASLQAMGSGSSGNSGYGAVGRAANSSVNGVRKTTNELNKAVKEREAAADALEATNRDIEALEKEIKESDLVGGGSSGGTGGGGSGDGGSGGGSTTTKKDTVAERIKKETSLINEAVLRQQNILKKQYATGLIDRQKYNQDMQNLEILRIQKILQIAGLEPEKVAELQNRLTDFAIKAREELEGIDFKPINESSADEFARMNEELDKKMNEQIAIVKQNLRLGNITREEYMKQLNDIDQQHFQESIKLWQDYNVKIQAKAKEGVVELTESQKNALQKFQDTLAPIMQEIGSTVGDGLAKAIRGEKGALKAALRETLKIIVESIQKMMIAMIVRRTVENVGQLGVWGLAKAAGEIALISVAGATLNGLIDGFASGGYTGKGGAYETAGVVHKGEFVANRFAVQNPAVKSVLDVIDQAQKTGTVANLTTEDLASVARSSATTNSQISSNDALSASMVAVLKDCTSMLAAVKKRFDEPIIAETYVTGKGGSEEAARLFDRMNRNANRK